MAQVGEELDGAPGPHRVVRQNLHHRRAHLLVHAHVGHASSVELLDDPRPRSLQQQGPVEPPEWDRVLAAGAEVEEDVVVARVQYLQHALDHLNIDALGDGCRGRGEHADDPRRPPVQVPGCQVGGVTKLLGRIEDPQAHRRAGGERLLLVEDAANRRWSHTAQPGDVGEGRAVTHGSLYHARRGQWVTRHPAIGKRLPRQNPGRNSGDYPVDTGRGQAKLRKVNDYLDTCRRPSPPHSGVRGTPDRASSKRIP